MGFLEGQLEMAESKEMTVGENRHSGERSHCRRILEIACQRRAENEERSRNLEILESLLGEDVHG